MNILQLSPQTPYPLNAGAKVGIYGTTKSLNDRGHKVCFVSYRKDVNRIDAITTLKEICDPYLLEYMANNNPVSALMNMFSPVPYNIYKYKTKQMERFLKKLLKEQPFDVVHVDHLHMAWVIDVIKNIIDIPVVLRQHNLELKIMKRYHENQKNPLLKFYTGIQYKKFLEYEPSECMKFDNVMMISKNDEVELLKLNKNIKTSVIPVGVASHMLEKQMPKNVIPYSMFHVGPMEWFPNFDGLTWYLNEVFPLIIKKVPEIKLFLYSSGVEALVLPDNVKKNVIIRGNVPNLWDDVADKQLAIVPLRIGSGMRTKIIEMLGYGQNIISTDIGYEGIDVTDGKNIISANTPIEFADKTFEYFDNRYDKENLSLNAKKLVKEKYTWDIIGKQFEDVYNKVKNDC